MIRLTDDQIMTHVPVDLPRDAVPRGFLLQEIHTSGVIRRHMLIGRARRLAGPLDTPAPDPWLEALEDLVSEGLVIAGADGWVAPAPMRLVRLAPGRWRVMGALATHTLREVLDEAGIGRTVTDPFQVEPELAEAVERAVTDQGWWVLTEDQFCGLAQAPLADERWIEALDRRLGHSKPQVSEEALEWRTYTPRPGVEQKRRWQKPTAESPGRLWRAWTGERGWRFTWTTGGGEPGAGLPLHSDEATRTMFALERQVPLVVRATQDAEGWALDLAARLPLAEYRLLSLKAKRLPETGWRVASDDWEGLRTTLAERLGLAFEEVS